MYQIPWSLAWNAYPRNCLSHTESISLLLCCCKNPTPYCDLSHMNQDHSLLPYLCKSHLKVKSLIQRGQKLVIWKKKCHICQSSFCSILENVMMVASVTYSQLFSLVTDHICAVKFGFSDLCPFNNDLVFFSHLCQIFASHFWIKILCAFLILCVMCHMTLILIYLSILTVLE